MPFPEELAVSLLPELHGKCSSSRASLEARAPRADSERLSHPPAVTRSLQQPRDFPPTILGLSIRSFVPSLDTDLLSTGKMPRAGDTNENKIKIPLPL